MVKTSVSPDHAIVFAIAGKAMQHRSHAIPSTVGADSPENVFFVCIVKFDVVAGVGGPQNLLCPPPPGSRCLSDTTGTVHSSDRSFEARKAGQTPSRLLRFHGKWSKKEEEDTC